MRQVIASEFVNAGQQRVWDLYADVKGSEEWVPFLEEVTYLSGPAGLGQVYRERTRLAGMRGDAEWRVIEWDPPRRQVQLSSGFGLETRLVIEVEPIGADRARVRQRALVESHLPRPIAWAHELLVAAVAQSGIRAAVRAAKRRLEGERP